MDGLKPPNELTQNGLHIPQWPSDLMYDLDKISTESFRYARPQIHDPVLPAVRSHATGAALKPLQIPSQPRASRVGEIVLSNTAAVSPRKSLVLCFDGTGNKFSGTASDSNILKIYSLLDKQDANQFHYYQPGIGTYVETSSLSHKSRFGRIKSWYLKAKDQAIGTSFGEHVMAGYKFLMRYYSSGDDIYFFGFSRGAYTARFLAELLDSIGLLSAGNEEMLRFAWKTFARWQMRTEDTDAEQKAKRETFEFMKKFRETFSRPVDRIRFIGLFDCVNSVPQFETAWMTRTKFPYTAKTSARTIRHAVSIDERRAKFRQDLISQRFDASEDRPHHFRSPLHRHRETQASKMGYMRPVEAAPAARYRRKSRGEFLDANVSALDSAAFVITSATAAHERSKEDEPVTPIDEESDIQDILEVWFAGQHGDIGGGWPPSTGEKRPASDLPLMWMIREAHNAGIPFDEDKLRSSQLFPERRSVVAETPALMLDNISLAAAKSKVDPFDDSDVSHDEMLHLHTRSRLHDVLSFGGGSPAAAVLTWKFMEHLPFRRMDLQPDGSWKPISWPLPRGEVRDMPAEALVHGSVIRRMRADGQYRPGNLIVGGGGRGVRKAPPSAGTGSWRVVRNGGDMISEILIKHAKSPA